MQQHSVQAVSANPFYFASVKNNAKGNASSQSASASSVQHLAADKAQEYRLKMRTQFGLVPEADQNRVDITNPYMAADVEKIQQSLAQYQQQVRELGSASSHRWLDLVPWTSMS